MPGILGLNLCVFVHQGESGCVFFFPSKHVQRVLQLRLRFLNPEFPVCRPVHNLERFTSALTPRPKTKDAFFKILVDNGSIELSRGRWGKGCSHFPARLSMKHMPSEGINKVCLHEPVASK